MLRYRLRELIYQKYGEEKFAIACEIVARWLSQEERVRWTQEQVLKVCDMKFPFTMPMTSSDGEKLRQLFGLQSVEDIFNNEK